MYLIYNRSVEGTYHARFFTEPIPLHAAAYLGHSLVVRYLLEKGTGVSAQTDSMGI